MSSIELKDILVIGHLFGVAFGAGGAYMSDAMFFSSIKDLQFSKTEIRFLKLGGFMVWTGLGVLAATGLGLFLLDPAGYAASSKFLAKMTIIAALVANGIAFHRWHLPLIHRHAGEHVLSSDEFMRRRTWLMASGAVSFVSWSSAIVLGSLRGVPLPYSVIMCLYGLALCCAVLGALIVLDIVFPKKK